MKWMTGSVYIYNFHLWKPLVQNLYQAPKLFSIYNDGQSKCSAEELNLFWDTQRDQIKGKTAADYEVINVPSF